MDLNDGKFWQSVQFIWGITATILSSLLSLVMYGRKKNQDKMSSLEDSIINLKTDNEIFKIEVRELKDDIKEIKEDIKKLLYREKK